MFDDQDFRGRVTILSGLAPRSADAESWLVTVGGPDGFVDGRVTSWDIVEAHEFSDPPQYRGADSSEMQEITYEAKPPSETATSGCLWQYMAYADRPDERADRYLLVTVDLVGESCERGSYPWAQLLPGAISVRKTGDPVPGVDGEPHAGSGGDGHFPAVPDNLQYPLDDEG